MNVFQKTIGVFALLLTGLNLCAQQKTFSIGGKIPDTALSRIIRYQKPEVKLSAFSDKLLILDFWDTYCGSCIELMPKMDSLQNQFGNRIRILPVTYQSEPHITRFFNTNKYVKDVTLSCIVADKTLHNYFPHQTISHLVWIHKGVVMAITHPQHLTPQNIQMILDGKAVDWPVKTEDIAFDYSKPFAPDMNGQAFFKGYIQGVERQTGLVRDSINRRTRLYYINYTVLDMFYNAWSKIHSRRFIPHPGRRILEVKDPSKYIYDEKKEDREHWAAKNVICYERFFSKDSLSKEDYLQVIKDLNKQLSVSCRYEKRWARCLIISPLNRMNVPVMHDLPGLKKQKIDMIAFWLDYTYKYPPVIDESGYKLPISIAAWNDDLELLRTELNKNGFDIKEGMREIDQLILTELQ